MGNGCEDDGIDEGFVAVRGRAKRTAAPAQHKID
jgi:hypothetical protein